MANHEWAKGGYGHGTMHCKHCGCTEREAAALGQECDKAPEPVTGYAAKDDTGILIRTVTDSRIGAMVNWLCTYGGLMVGQIGDEAVEELFAKAQKLLAKDARPLEIVEITITENV